MSQPFENLKLSVSSVMDFLCLGMYQREYITPLPIYKTMRSIKIGSYKNEL